MKRLIWPVLLLAAVMVATSLVRRMHTSQPSTAAAPVANHRDQLYVEVSALGNLDYFRDHKLGMQQVGEALGVRTEYVGPAEYDIPAMITAMEQALAKPGLKGLVVVGFEPALNPVVNKAVEQGIPVVTVDADLPDSKRVAFVGTGNYMAGFRGGERLVKAIGGRGKVAIMTKAGQSNLEERVRGYKDAIAKAPGVELVQVVDTQSDAVIAAQVAAAVLRRHSDVAGLGCVEASGGVGAATAVKEARLAGKVKIVAMDRGNDVLEQIGTGVVDATVVQRTALMPFYAVQILYNLANAPVPIADDNVKAGVLPIPDVVDTGVILVDKTNYQHFLRR